MKTVGYIIVAIVAFIVAFGLTNAPSLGPGVDMGDIGQTDSTIEATPGYRSYYDQLTDYEKKIYDNVLPIVADVGEDITFKNVNVNDFKDCALKVMSAVQYDNPQYFWLITGYKLYTSVPVSSDIGSIKLELVYHEYANGFFNAEKQMEELDEAVKRVANLAKKHSSDPYERMVFVHDYLIETAIYDHDALDEYETTVHDPSCEYIFSAYGCLVNGKTVCSGYAKAFQLVMWELGYECSYVTGDAGGPHGWNCVYIDGDGYYVDVTWDDCDFEKEEPSYDYAFITGDDLSKTHDVEDKFFPEPICTETEYNYYNYHGYYAKTYSFASASKIIEKQIKSGSAHIRFASFAEYEKAYDELISKRRFRDIDGVNKKASYSCTYSDKFYTISLFER